MEYVDEVSGSIARTDTRLVYEVEKGYTYFAEDDVLFAKITPCMENGKCAIGRGLLNHIGYGSTEFHVLRAGDETLPEWIYYFLRQSIVRKQLERRMTGSAGQKRVPARVIGELEIPLPLPDEQRRIAAILRRADRARRLARYTVELGEGYLQSVFIKMFGDLIDNPNGWKFQALGILGEVVSGVTKGQRFNGRETIELPYLRVANVQDGYLDLSEIKMIRALVSEAQQLILQPGDILMTEGGDSDKLGRGAIWEGQIDNCIHQNHIFRVRFQPDTVHPVFFSNYLLSSFAKQYFLRASKKTTNLASINMTQLKALPVPRPPEPLQDDFVAFTKQFDRIRAQQQEQLRQAEHLFASLLDRAFRGEV